MTNYDKAFFDSNGPISNVIPWLSWPHRSSGIPGPKVRCTVDDPLTEAIEITLEGTGVSATGTAAITAALFVDNEPYALDVWMPNPFAPNFLTTIDGSFRYFPHDTEEHVFEVRLGVAGGTGHFNGTSAVTVVGGASNMTLEATTIKADPLFVGNVRPASTSNLWPAGDGFAVVECGCILYKFGGWNTAAPAPHTSRRVEMSSDGGATWAQLPDMPCEARHTFPVVSLNGKMYLIGGDANSGHYQTDFWEITPVDGGLSWNCITMNSAALSQGRVGHICFPFEGKIVMVGGQIIDGESFLSNPANYSTKPGSPYYDDMQVYTPGDADFVKVADNCGYAPASFMQGSPVKDGKMWLVGCGAYSIPARGIGRVFDNRVYSGDLTGWNLVTANGGFIKCMYNSVAVLRDDIVTFGGGHFVGSTWVDLNQLHASRDGVTFRDRTRSIIRPRHAATLFNSGNELRLLGGPISPPDTAVWCLS